ncbi:hypothetical protein [Paenibacillus lactis]|uniref:Uncharacterized protein n=1 Tax=Paenibacillus lactis 154 TaxID=743719 RepID=G4HIY5_9BACL|nr:hypothetical protein [Paenibacillus lactis]EHB62703.1 hypothetical protein PaelaDRAFT_3946 [Paenibacillus lactis 154]
MNETRPQWYEKAKQGPFENKRFTANHKQAVMMKIEESKSSSTRFKDRGGNRKRMYRGYTAAAILVLVAAGWLWNSEVFNTNPTYQAQSMLTEVPPAGVTNEVWNTARSAMSDVVGKEMKFERSEKLDNNQMLLKFRGEGDDFADLWIDTASNEVVRAISTANLPKASAASMDDKAKNELKKLGYKGQFDYSVERHVMYNLDNNTQDTVLISLKSEDAKVDFSNGEMESVWLSNSMDDVPLEVEQAASAALQKLRGTEEIPPLTKSFQTNYIRLGHHVLELHYGEDAIVYYELNQQEITQVSDWSLNGTAKSSIQVKEQHTVKDAVAPLINNILGVDITSYQETVNMKNPGSYLFVKEGEPSIEVAYNANKYVYSIIKHIYED